MTDTTPRRLAVLSWDHREQIDFDLLARLLSDMTDGRLHAREAETDSDQYALVLSDQPLSETDAAEIYRTWWRAENEPT